MLHEQGTTDINRYIQLLNRTANDPNAHATVRQSAQLLRNLIDVRSQERRRLSFLSEAIANLIKTSKDTEGAWSEVSHELETAAANAEDLKAGELLEGLREQIQRFIDTYLLTILHALRDPLKASELSSLLRHRLGSSKDDEDEEEEEKTTNEAEVLVEVLRQKYAHPLLLMKLIVGPKEMSKPGRVLLSTFEELSPEFPAFANVTEGRHYLLKQYEGDPYLGADLKKATDLLDQEEKLAASSSQITRLGQEPQPPDEPKGEEQGPPSLLTLSRTFHKTRAAKLLDVEAGSMAPGQQDLLDDSLDYVRRIWKESLTWEPHPNYEQLRYFRDHLVRLVTSGHVMELLLRSYREVHRYEASDIVTLDTQKLLTIPAVREIVCLMLYPKLQRVPGFNTRIFESLLGRQYANLLKCCRDIASLDVFVHDEWPENLDQFLDKFDATYQTLASEEAGAANRFLNLLRRRF